MLEKINKIRLEDNIVLQEMSAEDKYYALNIENGDCFELTHTAYFILDLIQKTNDINVIIASMITKYDLTHDEAQNDLFEILENFIELGCCRSVTI